MFLLDRAIKTKSFQMTDEIIDYGLDSLKLPVH